MYYIFLCVCVCVRARAWLRACSFNYTSMQRAAILSSAVSLCFHHIFRHYVINGTIFGKKVTEHKMCFFLQLLFETFFILRKIHGDIVINVKTS